MSPDRCTSALLVVLAALLLTALLTSAGSARAQQMNDADYQRAVAQLAGDDPTERAAAADLLGRRGYSRRDTVVPLLRQHLREDRDWRVRASSGRAIGRLGVREAVPDLVRALRDPVVDVRVVAAAAIWRLPDPAAVPALLELLRDQDASARQWGALALGVIRDRRATRPLIALLRDPEGGVRLDSIRSLGRVRDATAAQPLERYAADDAGPMDERLEAISALSSLDGPEKVDALVRLTRHADAQIRTRAVQSLGRVGDALVVPALRERRTAESAAAVRAAIDAAIREIQERLEHGDQQGSRNVPLNLPPLPD
jgi:HEAT repeat protein